jgi:serine/threonine protein kinase
MSIMSSAEPRIGDVPPGITPKSLFGYDILAKIGTGAASTLYAVSKPNSGQLYVLKHVVIQPGQDERFIDQLKAEYEIGRKFEHPVLRRSVSMMDHHTLFTRRLTEAALLLELFDGEPIAMAKFSHLPIMIKALADAARGLEALHKLGYIHCDLKPDNILIGNHGEGVKIIDFGQTCEVGTAKPRMQGSPHYMAPEQLKCQALMPRTDVFNFGATIYRVVTRRNMETAYTRKLAGQHADQKIPKPIEVEPRLPQALSDLITRCVQPQPANRPAMHDVAAGLTAIWQSLPRREKKTYAA